MKKLFFVLFLVALSMALSGCADTVYYTVNQFIEPVGFLHGLWHGYIIVISWFCSLFNNSVSIYAVYNTGGWYDFGFILGVGSFASIIRL